MRLFVYGTLLPEFPQHALIRPYLGERLQPGRVKGRLVDVGDYPALVVPGPAAEGGLVRGIWVEIDRAGLAVADEYEDYFGIEETNDYERIWIADADDPSVEGWTYAWPDSRGLLYETEEWWPAIRSRRGACAP